MGHVADQLLAEDKFPKVIEDCSNAVRAEIKRRGLGTRTVFKLATSAKPNLIEAGLRRLLPDFADALEPFYDRARAENTPFDAYVAEHRDEVAGALLQVTDGVAEQVDNGALRGGYQKLRGKAENEVAESLPRLAPVLARHIEPA